MIMVVVQSDVHIQLDIVMLTARRLHMLTTSTSWPLFCPNPFTVIKHNLTQLTTLAGQMNDDHLGRFKGQDRTGYRLLQSGCSCTSTFETGLGWLYNPPL